MGRATREVSTHLSMVLLADTHEDVGFFRVDHSFNCWAEKNVHLFVKGAIHEKTV